VYAQKLVAYLQDILETMGIQKERLKMIFVSAAEGERFRQLCIEMDTVIRKLGPNPMKSLPSTPTPATPAKTA